MTTDHIWDDTDGTLLATIKDGEVFHPTDNRRIGTISDGNIYGLNGELIGHVELLHDSSRGAIPEAFRKLTKGNDG